MNFEYYLEIDESIDKYQLCKICIKAGAQVSLGTNNVFNIYFSNSDLKGNIYKTSFDQRDIKADDQQNLCFSVCWRCIFRFNTFHFDEKIVDFEFLLESIYKLNQAKFIVSFQLETVHYLSDGLVFKKLY